MTSEKVVKKYATIDNPTISAVLKSLFRFSTEQQALDRVRQLRNSFVISTHAPQETAVNTAIIWVRGYGLTEEEITQGYTGNYILIAVRPHEDKFTLTATKLESDLKFHPQKKRPKKSHPDWGHPILRDIKKGRTFDSVEDANNELMRLHEEFPLISIPDEGRLLIILYEKVEGTKSPVHKYKFEVKPAPEGGFFISYARNTRRAKSRVGSAQAADSKGYFTSMVKLKKKKPAKPASS